jgi:hypothetical protein
MSGFGLYGPTAQVITILSVKAFLLYEYSLKLRIGQNVFG